MLAPAEKKEGRVRWKRTQPSFQSQVLTRFLRALARGSAGSPGARLKRDQPFPDGVARQLGDAEQFELVHELPAVRLDGLDAHLQRARHLLGAVALGNELQHFA